MKCLPYLENRCKSCVYLGHPYSFSIESKEKEFFCLFPNLDRNIYLPAKILNKVNNSRNKAKLAVSEIGGELFFGIYDRHQKFQKLEDCPLHIEGINGLLQVIKKLLIKYKIPSYDLVSKKGELKNILITKSDTTNHFLIRFVIRSKESLDRLRKVTQELLSSNTDVQVVSANLQPLHAAILEGEEEIILSNEKTIIHMYEGISLHLGVKSFFQVTSNIARELYASVGNFLQTKKIESLLDLYCGVGAFSFYASKSVSSVLGVEISTEAINCAQLSKELNQTTNVEFKALDVDQLWSSLPNNYQCILVNPPRRGVGETSMKKIKDLRPEYFIYSSCNVETLHSDFAHIQDDYKIISSQIFDMFPYSKHFEVLMIFERIN